MDTRAVVAEEGDGECLVYFLGEVLWCDEVFGLVV